jgi:hypothetical protein
MVGVEGSDEEIMNQFMDTMSFTEISGTPNTHRPIYQEFCETKSAHKLVHYFFIRTLYTYTMPTFRQTALSFSKGFSPARRTQPPANRMPAMVRKAERTLKRKRSAEEQSIGNTEQAIDGRFAAWARALKDNGAVVVPVLSKARLSRYSTRVRRDMMAAPTFVDGAALHVLGGFGAFGNPGSFHALSVRRLRILAHTPARSVLRCLAEMLANDNASGNTPWSFEQIPDRTMLRMKGKSPTAEAWHRDESPNAHADDIVLGGWINLNTDKDQAFSGVLGTHILASPSRKGFSSIPRKDRAAFKALATKTLIPPGHMLIFVQNMVHEVLSRKEKSDTLRLFTAFRLTPRALGRGETLIPSMPRVLRDMEPVPMKSSQMPPMWASMHWNLHRSLIASFTAANIEPGLHITMTVRSGPTAGTEFVIVPRFLKSIPEVCIATGKDMDHTLYPDYSDTEIALYQPERIQ